MTESASKMKLKVNDRVRRTSGGGCYGTIKDIRAELTSAGHKEEKEKNYLANVQWDNGTLSYFSPSALEVVKE